MRPQLFAASLALALVVPSQLLAAPAQPLGNEFRVNSDTASQQHDPVATYDHGGNAFVVWANDQDGVRGRFVAASGAMGNEIGLVANTGLPSIPGEGNVVYRKSPTAVFVANGKFVLFWTEERDHVEALPLFQNTTLLGRDIYMQVFRRSGVALTSPTKVNQAARGLHSEARAVVLPNGNVFVVWESASQFLTPGPIDGIFGRVVSPNGALLTNEFPVTPAPSLAHNAALALDAASGLTMVTWQGSFQGAPGLHSGVNIQVHGRLFDGNAQGVSNDLLISTGSATVQARPGVATDGKGNFLVLWQENYQDIWHARIDGQFVNTAGKLVGPIVKIQGFAPAQISPSLAATPSGSFVAIWMEYEQAFPVGMNAVEIDAHGAVGSTFWINEKPIGAKTFTNLATDGSGNFVIPYESFYSGNDLGIVVRLATAN